MHKYDYLDVREAAEILRLCEETIRVYCRTGKIRAAKVGGQWLIPESELKRLAAVTTHKGEA